MRSLISAITFLCVLSCLLAPMSAGAVDSGSALRGVPPVRRTHPSEVTQEETFRLAQRLASGGAADRMDARVLTSLRRAIIERGSPELVEFVEAVSDLHRRGDDGSMMATMIAIERTTDQVELVRYENELRQIIRDSFRSSESIARGTTPLSSTLDADAHTEVVPVVIAVVISAGACSFGAAACGNDAGAQLEGCLGGNYCPPGKSSNSGCCQRYFEDDMLNCYVTCGTNRPDRDELNCCS